MKKINIEKEKTYRQAQKWNSKVEKRVPLANLLILIIIEYKYNLPRDNLWENVRKRDLLNFTSWKNNLDFKGKSQTNGQIISRSSRFVRQPYYDMKLCFGNEGTLGDVNIWIFYNRWRNTDNGRHYGRWVRSLLLFVDILLFVLLAVCTCTLHFKHFKPNTTEYYRNHCWLRVECK